MDRQTIPTSSPAGEPRKVRRRLWEVHHGNHCAILGTCLSLKATRRILRKAKIPNIGGATDYAVHCTAVDLAQHRGTVARLLDKALERTHAKSWAVYGRLRSADHLRAQWRHDLQAGDITGPFWAVMHHPAADRDLLLECFGTVHMLSHQVGGSCRDRLRRFDEVHEQLAAADRHREKREHAHLAEIRSFKAELAERDQLLIEQKKETLMWRRRAEAGDPDRVAALEEERDHRIRALARAERQLRHAKETIERLQHALRLAEEKPSDIPNETGTSIALHDCEITDGDSRVHDQDPVDHDLAGCTLLYVGGEKRLLPHLRRVTHQANGRLLHHDGGIEDNLRTLPRLCARADVVLCPMSKVGHMAVGHVKRSCLESCKPFIPLRRASLESFCSGLNRIAESIERQEQNNNLIH